MAQDYFSDKFENIPNVVYSATEKGFYYIKRGGGVGKVAIDIIFQLFSRDGKSFFIQKKAFSDLEKYVQEQNFELDFEGLRERII